MVFFINFSENENFFVLAFGRSEITPVWEELRLQIKEMGERVLFESVKRRGRDSNPPLLFNAKKQRF